MKIRKFFLRRTKLYYREAFKRICMKPRVYLNLSKIVSKLIDPWHIYKSTQPRSRESSSCDDYNL